MAYQKRGQTSGGNSAAVMKTQMKDLKAYLRDILPKLQEVAAKSIDPQRMVRLVAMAASRNPRLLQCTPLSVVSSMMTSAQLGLECVGPLGQAYLVPYRNGRTGVSECQFQIGYRGLIELTRRSGSISNIEAHVVYEQDDFELAYGLDTVLKHKPYMGAENPGEIICAYAVARFKDGSWQLDVMSRAEIEGIRKRSMSGKKNEGPWKTDYSEMARKTVVKRLCKYLPLSVELADAIAMDNAAETGEAVLGAKGLDAIDVDVDDSLANDVSFLEGPDPEVAPAPEAVEAPAKAEPRPVPEVMETPVLDSMAPKPKAGQGALLDEPAKAGF